MMRSAAFTVFSKQNTKLGTKSRFFLRSFSDHFQLYDSLSQQKDKPLVAVNDTTKGLACYTCGPTTYAPAHLGHARTYVCLDILRRVLEDRHSNHTNSGSPTTAAAPPPLFVMNITDIDDKIINQAAAADDDDPIAWAQSWEADFWDDLQALHCRKPHIVTRVSEHVDTAILPFIQRLWENGVAYTIHNDGVYFNVTAFNNRNKKKNNHTRYGKLGPPAIVNDKDESLKEEEDHARDYDSSLTRTKKHDARDFALWKFQQDDDQTSIAWPSPWGRGRPGWHIECSAMIQAVQDQFQETHQFRLHCGGIDLQFPHHCNEIAQSEAYLCNNNDENWIPHWVHTGHLHIHGRKMSKSLKNFISIRDFLDTNNTTLESPLASRADDFRMWCLAASHYRSTTVYSEETLATQGHQRRMGLVRFLVDANAWLQRVGNGGSKKWTPRAVELQQVAHEVEQKAQAALNDDLNGRLFVKELETLVDAANRFLSSDCNGPPEVIVNVVSLIRNQLALVGFSNVTVEAGNETEQPKSQIIGGEIALLEALVDFRALVREGAMQGHGPEEMLALCDNVRDSVAPKLGIELFDGATTTSNSSSPGDSPRNGTMGSRYSLVVPMSSSDSSNGPPPLNDDDDDTRVDLTQVALEDLFRLGIHRQKYMEFDELGIPTVNADGSNVSNRQRKKLVKKRNKHMKRLEAAAERNNNEGSLDDD